jgi:hypothetical protein
MAVIHAVVNEGLRPALPAALGCSPALAALMQRCWAADTLVRPTFDEIVPLLEAPRLFESTLTTTAGPDGEEVTVQENPLHRARGAASSEQL